MANEKTLNPSSVVTENSPKKGQEDAQKESDLSPDQMDEMIKNEDPDFFSTLESLSKDDQNLIDLSESIQIQLDPKVWAEMTPKMRFIWYFSRLNQRVKLFAIKLKSLLLGTLIYVKNKIVSFILQMKEVLKKISKFSLKKKAFLGFLLFLIGFCFFYAYKSLTKGWIHEPSPPFVRSFSEWAEAEYIIPADEIMEPFFDSARVASNVFVLKRIVVNIRRSSQSGPNPMAAVELIVEGSSGEVVVEVKDRETEIRDILQRVLEDHSYDQLVSQEGKRMLLEKMRLVLNQNLTTGLIRKVYIKTILVKP